MCNGEQGSHKDCRLAVSVSVWLQGGSVWFGWVSKPKHNNCILLTRVLATLGPEAVRLLTEIRDCPRSMRDATDSTYSTS